MQHVRWHCMLLGAPNDYFAGLEAMMPVESLRATVTRSLDIDLRRKMALKGTADVLQGFQVRSGLENDG